MKQYKREDLTERDVCEQCKKDLRTVDEIHASEGHLFCSKECAIDFYTNKVIINAKESATAMYNDFAEIVTPEDIGIER